MIMKRFSLMVIFAVTALAGMDGAQAGSLVYTPVNPSFGGSPLNGTWMLSQAQAQNQFTQSRSASASSALSTGQLFANQLTSQVYSSLANKITQAMFGDNAQTSGSYSFGGTSISFEHVGSNIQISINDGTSITNLTVPATP